MRNLTAMLSLVLAASAHAAGFAVDTHGGKATGLATAVTAHIDDPSTVFYNPAGLLHLEGVQVMAGATLINPNLRITSQQSGQKSSNEFSIVPPPHAYATARITGSLAVGLGVFTNYGSADHWDANWEFRYRALSSDLKTFNFNPEVAYSPHERVRLGVGLQVVHATVVLSRKINFIDSDGLVTLSGAANGIGANAGLQVDLIPKVLSAGLAYRSGVHLPFTGSARFENIPAEFAELTHDQNLSTSIRTADTVFAGVALRPFEALTLAADAHYYRWSTMKAITVDFEDPSLNQSLPKHWHDTVNFHLGAEYRWSPTLAFRLGAVYDPTPSPLDTLTPDLPDSNRMKLTAGVGYTRGQLRFDTGYQLVILRPAHSSAPGYEADYSGHAHVLGLSVAYAL